MSAKIYQKFLPVSIGIFQTAVLFFLRRIWLRTVFQTVASYFLLCAAGIVLMLWAQKKDRPLWSRLWDSYLMFWSGIHGVIVLGFMTCGTFYLTWTEVTFVQLVNLFLGWVLYWVLLLLLRKPHRAVGAGNLLIGILGTVNFYLVRFRGTPLRLADLKSLRTAGNVAKNYDFTPDIILLAAIAELIVWYWIWRKYYKYSPAEPCVYKPFPPVFAATTAVLAAGCILLPVLKYDKIYADTPQFADDTYLAGLLAEVMGSGESLPQDYSAEKVRQIIHSFQASEPLSPVQSNQKPDIIVIMNEAFADLRILGDFETNVPTLEFWDSLTENTVRGWANVSVLGGNTANSEYEFLTSDTLGAYTGKVPYTSFFDSQEPYPGLVSVLKEQGYETTVFHPYLSSGWNRTRVYRNMQFDRLVFLEDLDRELETLRLYVSDKGDFSYIRDWFDKITPDTPPQFFFNITMQNHGGYTYKGDNFQTTVELTGSMSGLFPDAEQYLSLIKASDEALKELLAYFSQCDRPVIVVVFGDHQPKLEDAFYTQTAGQPAAGWSLEQKMNLYKTPFVIWHNYPVESKNLGNVSLNYLASILLEDAGLDMSPYQRYALDKYEEIPVITTLGMLDREGRFLPRGSSEYAEALADYRLLVFNHTVDTAEIAAEFFSLNRPEE